MFTRIKDFFKGYGSMGKGNWGRAMLLIVALGGLAYWQLVPRIKSAAMTDMKVASADTCKEFVPACNAASKDTCGDFCEATECPEQKECAAAASTETCGAFCPAAPACNAAGADSCKPFCAPLPAPTLPTPPSTAAPAPAAASVQVTFTNNGAAGMDITCSGCGAITASKMGNDVFITLTQQGNKVARCIDAGNIAQGTTRQVTCPVQ